MIKPEKITEAKVLLKSDFSKNIKILRKALDENAKKLYNLIGIQLDVENYHESGR